jgi:hypothetical protein
MKKHHFGGLPFLVLLASSPIYAINLPPGDVRAPKPGINFIQLTYQRSQRGDRYLQGEKQPGDSAIQATQVQVRLGRSFELGGYPAVSYAQTPMGYIHPKGLLSRWDFTLHQVF